MLFVYFVYSVALIGGSVVGYHGLLGWTEPPRFWTRVGSTAAGAAAAAVFLFAFLYFSGNTSLESVERIGPAFVTVYTLFGILLGCVGAVTRIESGRRLFLIGIGLEAVLLFVLIVLNPTAHLLYERSGLGGYFNLHNLVVVSVIVFLVRSGPTLIRRAYAVVLQRGA